MANYINDNEKVENQEISTNICNERCMPCDEYLYDLSELFRIFGDSTRIKILYSLFEGELCVNDMSALLNLSQ